MNMLIKPLAFRMRPNTLDEIIGQEHLLGEDGFLSICLKKHKLVSMILYGPPGTGKTTIAHAFANSMKVRSSFLNAVTCAKSDLVEIFDNAKKFGEPYILILDEVHRLNKDKQDLLLPHLEDGTIFLIGATTANPLLAINKAIRSRTHLLEVKMLSEEELIVGLKNAIISVNGFNNEVKFEDDALALIAKLSGGDMRFALNYLEVSALSYNNIPLNTETIKRIVKVPNFLADSNEEQHYDTVSALQKSIRGSDVDAAIYYLAKLISSGDLESIARRLMVTAYEDVGLGNPQAVDRVVNAINVAREVGFPEAKIPLAFSVVELALSPKSKSVTVAIEKALETITSSPEEVRDYLKLTPVSVQNEDKYPYDNPRMWENMLYLPSSLTATKFYLPCLTGNYEKSLEVNYVRLQSLNRTANLRLLRKRIK